MEQQKTAKQTSTYRKPATEAARQHAKEYQRRYRQENPDRVKKWRDNYILRKAAQLMAEAEQDTANADGGQLMSGDSDD